MNAAWQFPTIAFQPYPDVGKFVNVGAVAVSPFLTACWLPEAALDAIFRRELSRLEPQMRNFWFFGKLCVQHLFKFAIKANVDKP